MEELHKPVLISEVLAVLQPKRGESYLDLTAGYAGHAERILDVTRNYKSACLVDRDDFAIDFLRGKYESEPVEIVKAGFCSAAQQLLMRGSAYDMILMDFGVSSPQLDRAERGFSLQQDGPLDMRMDRTQELTASDVVNGYSERELVRVLTEYGEVKPGLAQKLARMIVHGRPWNGTQELATAVSASVLGVRNERKRGTSVKGAEQRMWSDAEVGESAKNWRTEVGASAESARSNAKLERAMRGFRKGRRGVHPATQVFQAIRMEVNDELGEIRRTLPLIPRLLNPGGRVAWISFHSLEDRLVKDYLREVTSYGEESELKVLTKSPIVAESEELFINPRARSAKLRAAEQL